MSLDYNISAALLGLTEESTRRKGEQRGFVRWKFGAWQIRFSEWRSDDAGNLKYVSVERRVAGDFPHTARGQKQAEQAGYEQWVSKANAENKVPQGLATLGQFYELRFKVDHVDRLKKSGRIHYRTQWVNHIQPTLGGLQMRDVTPQTVQRLISAKVASGTLSPQSVKHVHNCIQKIFRHARNLRFFEGALPTEGVSLPPMTRKERHAMTWEQTMMLCDALPNFRHLIVLLVQTGMRIGEACGLLWKFVNLTDEWRVVEGEALPPNSVLVCSNWTKGERTSTKNRRIRKVPLTTEAQSALRLHWKMARFNGEDQPVFASRVGTPLDAHNVSNRILKPAARKLGIPWACFHVLRHTTATLADKAGLTVAEKQKILGHRTADLSTHYSHPEIEHVREAMERMGKRKPN